MTTSNTFFSKIILLVSFALVFSCSKKQDSNSGEQTNSKNRDSTFVFGVDLSYVNQIEDKFGLYRHNNQKVDPYQILAEKGSNTVRLRLWHNPDWIKGIYGSNSVLYSGFDDVAKSIQRAKAQNMKVNLDFHYSDIWADPGHQNPPAAWKNIQSLEVLKDSVYNYTFATLKKLLDMDLLPEMVQIGNENNCGMMSTSTLSNFPDLNVCNSQWQSFGEIVNAGIKAVRDIDNLSKKHTKIILHVADPKNLDWWFGEVTTKGGVVDFDIAGFSYYPLWHDSVSMLDLKGVIQNLKAKISKEVMVVETGYPFTGKGYDSYPNLFGSQPPLDSYPYSIEGQKQFLIDLTQIVVDAGGSGIMYWEPAWISSGLKDLWNTGSSWENSTFFDFTGNITATAEYPMFNYWK